MSNSLTVHHDKLPLEPYEITRALRGNCGKTADIGRGGDGICDGYHVMDLEAANTYEGTTTSTP